MLCPLCGWGDWVRPSCKTRKEADACDLNWENRRKYELRYKGQRVPRVVRSVRHQAGVNGEKGDHYERLVECTG